jgi:uncharacterized membrane protein YeaQ/YmgE (transglycosylase-associated protein family)
MSNFKFKLRNKIKHKIKLKSRVIEFNKEIFIGEVGAILGAVLFGFIGSLILRNGRFISYATLFGSVLGSSIFWLCARIYDEKNHRRFSVRKFSHDITLFTPVAFLISICFSYPTVLFMTNLVFGKDHISFFSSFIGELCGFTVFLIFINTYRIILDYYFNKQL